ncbi:MAG: 16S rRNA (uracil(1498)-N(3))-methyltransferase [Clostridiales bacterium]|nr:16S rRNA (uracil(1498)-N(3))-methyltransferase [Clostridiales bacterium]
MERFFVNRQTITNDHAVITGEDMTHITRVLRSGAGDMFILCDGCNMEYDATIEKIEKHGVTLRLDNERVCENEPPIEVTLMQALPKAGKLELVIQKCVELGVYAIQPLYTARCVVTKESFAKKHERYRRVAYEAAKQSRRGMIPKVLPLVELGACAFKFDYVLFAYENERERTLRRVLQAAKAGGAKRIAMIIGPEGGFEEEEARFLTGLGIQPLSLGKRVLRTETAGMAMLAMVMYELA